MKQSSNIHNEQLNKAMEVGMEIKEYIGKMFRIYLLRKRILGDIVEKINLTIIKCIIRYYNMSITFLP